MAKPEESKLAQRPKITDKDNPSLCEVGGVIHLRVHEDFFAETELPKWKLFKENKERLMKEMKLTWFDDGDIKRKLREIEKEDPEKAKRLEEECKAIKVLDKILEDDKWHIQEKHEREVKEALQKNAWALRLQPTGFKSKLKSLFKKKPKLVPVDVAFQDLKEHMILTSTEDLSKAKAAIDTLVASYGRSGQYAKAAKIKEYTVRIAEELALAKAGFTKYVTEEQMIDFIKKSERGVMVNFLRYYEGEIPDDVTKKKTKADEAMIFDNYVVAYFSDIVKEATAVETAAKKKTVEKERARRRDPILFGVIKQSRNLYYIADWVTPEDDLTLKLLEKTLGIKASKLVNILGPVSKLPKEVPSSSDTESVDLRDTIINRLLNQRRSGNLTNSWEYDPPSSTTIYSPVGITDQDNGTFRAFESYTSTTSN